LVRPLGYQNIGRSFRFIYSNHSESFAV
jgi:hypothetical protein